MDSSNGPSGEAGTLVSVFIRVHPWFTRPGVAAAYFAEAAAKAESGSFAKALRRRRAEHGSYLPIMPSGASGSRGTGAPAPCPTFGTLYEPEQKSTS